MANKHAKRCSTSSSKKCKLKQQWETTVHLLEWQKSKTLTTPNAGKDVEQQELSFIAGGNSKWFSHFGRLTVSHEIKYTLSIWSGNHAPWFAQIIKNLFPHKTCMQVFIAALFIIVKNWKQPRCLSASEWVNKPWYIQAMEYYSVLKRNEPQSHERTWRKLSERGHSEKAIYIDSKFMTFWKRLTYRDSKQTSRERGRDEQVEHRLIVWNYPVCYFIIVDARHTFVQIRIICNTKSEPQSKIWILGDNAFM